MKIKSVSSLCSILLFITGASYLSSAGAAAAVPTSFESLRADTNFSIFAGAAITTGASSVINGSLGAGAAVTTGASNRIIGNLYAGAAITTGASTVVDGNLSAGVALTTGASNVIYGDLTAGTTITQGATNNHEGSSNPITIPNSTSYMATSALLDIAMLDATGLDSTDISSELGNTTREAGTYSSATLFTLNGQLTLNGDADALFIFKSPGYISTAAGSSIVLEGGAQMKNIYWITGSYFSAGAGTYLGGNILATTYVTLGAGSKFHGRIYSQTSYITFGSSVEFN